MRHVIVGCLLLCPVAVSAQQPPPSRPDEAAIIEQIRTTVRFENDGTGRREVYMRVRAQSEAGVQQWGQVVLGYNAATERLEIPFVRVKKADGSVVTTSAQAVQDLTSPVQRIAPVYTDFHQKHVTVESFRPGDTLEVSYVTITHTPLARGQFWMDYDFSDEGIVLDEQLDIDVPSSRQPILKLQPGYDPSITTAGDRRVYHWAHAHTTDDKDTTDTKDAKDTKEQRKPDEPRRAAIRLTTFRDWKEVGKWFAELERTSRTPTPEIRQKAQELTAGRKTELEKLEALYDFVSKNFRYVSLSLGIARYQPRPAADVLHDAYGDCKDKHTLLASLIDAAGLHAAAVLINSSAKIDPDYPSPSQFDHVITRANAGGRDVWLDATPEVAPFELISLNLRKKQALVTDAGEGSHLEETPADAPQKGLFAARVNGVLNDAGALSADVTLTARGDVELLLRMAFRGTPQSQWEERVEQMAGGAGVSGKVSDLKVADPQATREPFTVAFHIEAEKFAEIAGKESDLPLPMNVMGSLATLSDSRGTGPVDLGTSGEASYHLELTLPKAARLRGGVPVSVTRDYGSYRATYGVADGRLTVERAITITQRELPEARRADYAAFVRVIAADGAQDLLLDGTAIAAPALSTEAKARELNRTGWEALQARDYEKAADLLRRAIAADPKEDTARVNLAIALLALHQPAPALDALQTQLELNPYDEFAYFYMGRAYQAQRKYDEAEKAFTKQLEVNPLDKFAPSALGAMYLDQRQYDKAAQAYEKAAAVNPDSAPAQIQLGTAYLNLHRADEARAAFARAAKLSPTPLTWNDVAYQLSLSAVDLDRAQEYAESAIAATAAASRNLDVERADARALDVVRSLGSYWDTLGWVYFAKGDLATAERFVSASWRLSQHPEVGDHLGQIYEKTGRTKEAINLYAQALAAGEAAERVREHLEHLAGAGKIDAAVAANREELVKPRTYVLKGTAAPGKADFLVLFAPKGVEGVKFIEGDETLKSLAPAIQQIETGRLFPDDTAAKLLRRGIAACAPTGRCTLTLLLPEDARPVK
jgi:tetratricopeptide (TPR) repeat protein/transglutaminase-like putative cysteine protease